MNFHWSSFKCSLNGDNGALSTCFRWAFSRIISYVECRHDQHEIVHGNFRLYIYIYIGV